MLNPEKEYLREQSYIIAERDIMEREQWLEWQEELKQKPAKITVNKKEEKVVKEKV